MATEGGQLNPVAADCQTQEGSRWICPGTEKDSGVAPGSCAGESAPGTAPLGRIPENYRKAALENFLLPLGTPLEHSMADVYLAVAAYVRRYPQVAKPGLLFVGATGTGKTHLAVAALRILYTRGYQGLFFDYQEWLEQVQAEYQEAWGIRTGAVYRAVREIDVLVLDDVGSCGATDWIEDTVAALLRYRGNHRKPLIATTNLLDAETVRSLVPGGSSGRFREATALEKRIGTAAQSRLFEMCQTIVLPTVEDYRIRLSPSFDSANPRFTRGGTPA